MEAIVQNVIGGLLAAGAIAWATAAYREFRCTNRTLRHLTRYTRRAFRSVDERLTALETRQSTGEP